MKVVIKKVKKNNKGAFEVVADNMLIFTTTSATALFQMLIEIGAAVGSCTKSAVDVKIIGDNES